MRNVRERRFIQPAILLALLCIIMAGSPVHALPGGQASGQIIPIVYGQTVSGAINNSQYEVIYSFEGAAGDLVTITMFRDDPRLDPYLVLYDSFPSQNPLIADDDSGGGLDAAIYDFRLPSSGTFYIVATRFGRETGAGGGGYALAIGASASPAPVPPATSPSLAGPTFECSGAVVEVASQVTFEDVRPGFQYQVTVLGLDGFDPVIGLTAEDGSSLCNDDAPDALGSTVEVPGVGVMSADGLTSQILFETSGGIADIVMSIGGYAGSSGRYAAVFEGLAIEPANEVDAITIDVPPAAQNQELLVYMVSETTELDPFMEIPNTGILCDDAGAGDCMGVPGFTGGGVAITNGSTYVTGPLDAGIGIRPGQSSQTFVFRSYGGTTSGKYAMVVIGSAPTSSTGPSTAIQPTPRPPSAAITAGGDPRSGLNSLPLIEYGSTVQNTISESNWTWGYAFSGGASDTVIIRQQGQPGSEVDPFVKLLDVTGSVLATDDDSGGDLNAELSYMLPNAGTYYIIATRFGEDQGPSSGPFTLTLLLEGASTGGTALLDYSQPADVEIQLSAGFTPDPYVLQGASGGPISIEAAVSQVCNGYAWGYTTVAPAYRLQYAAGQYQLSFYFEGEGDTSLVINAPDGQWYCDDDAWGELQPIITFSNPPSGQYDIWVGNYSENELALGALTITEQDLSVQQ